MADGALHPVQQAMVDCHGSQCGFCTPGFVMSLWATYQHHTQRGTRPTRQQLADELSGNLCRCTGYRPILDAGERMFDLPIAKLDAAQVAAALVPLQDAPPLRLRSANGGEFSAPRSLAAFAAERLADPEARILAGSTDIGLWVNKMFRDLPRLIYIGNVAELKRIAIADGVLSIGAAASLEDGWRALVARWPTLAEVWLRFAGVPLRHTGTIGGNVANGSPIGDSAPVLMALDARLVLRRGEALRRLPLADFYTGYMTNRLEPGEFVQAIEVPLESTARSPCLQDLEALRLRHLGGVRRPRDRGRRRGPDRRRATRLRRHGRDREARRRVRGRARRPAVERSDAGRGAVCACARLRAAQRHARERRLPPAGRAEPAAPLLARDARRCAARRPRGERLGRSARECAARDAHGNAMNRALDPSWLRAPTLPAGARVGVARPHESAHLHVAGSAPYVDDLPELAGTLHAALGLSPIAHGRITGFDRARIEAMPGVVAVLVAADIPGPNDCGPVIHDDPILADGVVQYLGQPVFAVIAETRDEARRAAAQAKAALTIAPLAPILTPVEAHAAQSYVLPPMHLVRGDARAAIAAAPHRLADTLEVGGQEQFYLEGQISYAVPREDSGMLVHCSTQHPSEMQHLVAKCLGLQSHHVQVECRRMGGGFGGKESQSALFACVAAIAAKKLLRPVKLRLDRDDDFLITGRRHCFHYEYEVGFDDEGRVLGAELTMVSRAGFSADLSGPGDDARDLPLRQRLLAARRRDPWLLGQDQHPEQHGVSRLRRTAGRDRDREHRRLDREKARQGPA